MTDQPPDFLHYESPHPPEPPSPEPATRIGLASVQVFVGLMAGCGVSFIAWRTAWAYGSDRWIVLTLIGLLLLKLLGSGVIMKCYPVSRFLGLGVILSIPLGGLIFFCTCAASIKF